MPFVIGGTLAPAVWGLTAAGATALTAFSTGFATEALARLCFSTGALWRFVVLTFAAGRWEAAAFRLAAAFATAVFFAAVFFAAALLAALRAAAAFLAAAFRAASLRAAAFSAADFVTAERAAPDAFFLGEAAFVFAVGALPRAALDLDTCARCDFAAEAGFARDFPDFPRELAAEGLLAFTGGFFEAMRGALPFIPLTFFTTPGGTGVARAFSSTGERRRPIALGCS